MRKNIKAFIFSALIFAIAFIAFCAWSWVEYQNDLPYYGRKKEFASNLKQAHKKDFNPVGSFRFINQDSQIITDKALKGKVWVADYFFTRCPTVCPIMSKSLSEVQKIYRGNDQLKIISFTCDPEFDTASKLKIYAHAFNADTNQWQFISGQKTELYKFARNQLHITATDGDGGETDFIHEQYLVLIDKSGYIRGYYDGTKPYEIKLLIRDIKKLL